jgi:cell division septation protein DedD
VITNLERGKYYIQVAALSRADSVERELARIGNSVPRAIQRSGTLETPIYRILIGPVNLGESGALLQRFRGIYNDAFVRLGS